MLTAAPKIATAFMYSFKKDFACARCASMFRCVRLNSFISAETASGCSLPGNETRLCRFVFNIVTAPSLFGHFSAGTSETGTFHWGSEPSGCARWLFINRAFGRLPADVPSGGVLAAAVSGGPPAERIQRYPDRALQSVGRNVHGGEKTRWRALLLMTGDVKLSP